MRHSLSKKDDDRYYIFDEHGKEVARLIRGRLYEGKSWKIRWMLMENGRLVRSEPFDDKNIAFGYYEGFKDGNGKAQ